MSAKHTAIMELKKYKLLDIRKILYPLPYVHRLPAFEPTPAFADILYGRHHRFISQDFKQEN